MHSDSRRTRVVDERNAPFALDFTRPSNIFRRMQGLFTGPDRGFWIYQCSLWGCNFVLRNLLALIQGTVLSGMTARVASITVGFTVTYVMWRILRRLTVGGVWRQIGYVVIMAIIGGAVHGLIFCLILQQQYPRWIGSAEFWDVLASTFAWDVWVLLAWGGLYLGIDYYGRFQEEKVRAAEASALAQQSQLKMLRYQLNPHFMFNTLNALSALVLTKNTERAERMILGLSRFLRYSLDSDPLTRLPLYRELEALSLYIGIERERFGDRLHIEERIEPEARSCLVPNLLLQPIIENALKYAVMPSKDGGTICLEAAVRGKQLIMSVSDTGPGFSRPVEILRQRGVGLSNTLARLERLYGAAAHMRIRNLEPRGLQVVLAIPAEFECKSAASGEPKPDEAEDRQRGARDASPDC